MGRHLLIALGLVAAGGAAGLAANSTWYKMDWLREPVAPAMPVGQGRASQSGIDGSGDSTSTPAKPGTIGMEDVLGHLADGTARFIDARKPDTYAEGHLQGAINLPSSAIYDRFNDLLAAGVMEDDLVVVYCGGGDCEASHDVTDALRRDFNFTKVVIYTNGWEEVEKHLDQFGGFVETGAGD